MKIVNKGGIRMGLREEILTHKGILGEQVEAYGM
jgi:hypothetical protein